jgi:hypothetical protein
VQEPSTRCAQHDARRFEITVGSLPANPANC